MCESIMFARRTCAKLGCGTCHIRVWWHMHTQPKIHSYPAAPVQPTLPFVRAQVRHDALDCL
jgi:hypothetical protein